MDRLSRWHARINFWLSRQAWGYAITCATVSVVILAIIQRDHLADLWPGLAVGWVLMVLVVEMARRWRARRTPPPGSDRPHVPDAMEEDGRRWRQGLP